MSRCPLPLACAVSLLGSIAAADPCTVGRWQADLADLADAMAVHMQGEAVTTGGAVTLDIAADGTFDMVVQNWTVEVRVAGAPVVPVSVDGASAGQLTFADGAWTSIVSDFQLTGSAEVLGSRMEIPFDSRTGLFGASSGSYACTGDDLLFDNVGETVQIPRAWRRIG